MNTIYPQLEEVFEEIHDFFKGAGISPIRIAQRIQAVAQYIHGFNALNYENPRLSQLTEELMGLAGDVRHGLVSDNRSFSRLPGIGYRRNPLALGWRD